MQTPRFQMYVNGVAWAGGGDGLTLAHFQKFYWTLVTAFVLSHPEVGEVTTVTLVAKQ